MINNTQTAISFSSLPYEINLLIMENLTYKDVMNLAATFRYSKDCHALQKVCLDDRLWRKFCSNTIKNLFLPSTIEKENINSLFNDSIISNKLISIIAIAEAFFKPADEKRNCLLEINNSLKETRDSLLKAWCKTENISSIDLASLSDEPFLQAQSTNEIEELRKQFPVDFLYKDLFLLAIRALTANYYHLPTYMLQGNQKISPLREEIRGPIDFMNLYVLFRKRCQDLLLFTINNLDHLDRISRFQVQLHLIELSDLLTLVVKENFGFEELINSLIERTGQCIEKSLIDFNHTEGDTFFLKFSFYMNILDQVIDAYSKTHSINKKAFDINLDHLSREERRKQFALSPDISILTKDLLIKIMETLELSLKRLYILRNDFKFDFSDNDCSNLISSLATKIFKLIISNSSIEEAIKICERQPYLVFNCLNILPETNFEERLDFISNLYDNFDRMAITSDYLDLYPVIRNEYSLLINLHDILKYLTERDFQSLFFIASKTSFVLMKYHPTEMLRLLNAPPKQFPYLRKKDIVLALGDETLKELALIAAESLDCYSEDLNTFATRFLLKKHPFNSRQILKLLNNTDETCIGFFKNKKKPHLPIVKEDLPLFMPLLEKMALENPSRIKIVEYFSFVRNFLMGFENLEAKDINELIKQAMEILIDKELEYSRTLTQVNSFLKKTREFLQIKTPLPAEERNEILQIFDEKTGRNTGLKRGRSQVKEPAAKKNKR